MTPTIWSHMRLCKLRGVFASKHAAEAWVLHDPRGWLGTAFHRVMQASARPGASADDAEMAWRSSVADAAGAAAKHPLDFRFGPAERWPGYFLVRQRALASAAQVRARPRAQDRSGAKRNAAKAARGTERRIETRDGRLAGRPDFFNGNTIVEYKSSLPDHSWPRAREVLDGYRRQLRLYAAILADVENRWPGNARLVAASGQVMEIRIDPEECKAEAEAALEALSDANSELLNGTPPETLARPNSVSCGRCPFQAVCPAFWKWIEKDGMADQSVAAALKVESIDVAYEADLYTAHVTVLASSRPMEKNQVIVLRRSVHGDLSDSPKGTRWRIVSAAVRGDSRLRANISTVVHAEKSVPKLAVRLCLESGGNLRMA